MIKIFKTTAEGLIELSAIEDGCWVHMVAPTDEELTLVEETVKVVPEFLRAALDDEERSRTEADEGQALVLVDIPRVELEGKNYVYTTLPFGLIHTPEVIISVCLAETPLVRDFIEGRVRGFCTYKKTRFIFQLLHRNAARFLSYLRQIDRASDRVHAEMQRSYRNKELLQMMALEKSLVFFSTSLKANELVLEKLMKNDVIKKYPDDEELLDDVIIENRQAMEMCSIYRDILSGMMDAYASIISNNLNIVMKLLAVITIVIAVPTMVTSAWGMNVRVPFTDARLGFWYVMGIAILGAVIALFFMKKRRMF